MCKRFRGLGLGLSLGFRFRGWGFKGLVVQGVVLGLGYVPMVRNPPLQSRPLSQSTSNSFWGLSSNETVKQSLMA